MQKKQNKQIEIINRLYAEIKENNRTILNNAIYIGNLLDTAKNDYNNKVKFSEWVKHKLDFDHNTSIKFLTLYNDKTVKDCIT